MKGTTMNRYCVTIPANSGINNTNQPVEFWTSSESTATSFTTSLLKQGIKATLRQSVLQQVNVEQPA
jgi:hypothetical protein